MTEAEKVIKSSACTWLGVVGGCLHLAGSVGRVPAPGWEWWTGACTWLGVVDGCLHLDGSGGRVPAPGWEWWTGSSLLQNCHGPHL